MVNAMPKNSVKNAPTAHDVAAYILEKHGPMSAMKMHKLVYYCQAWSLVWEDRPIFNEPIQAWVNGPVVPALYEQHKGEFGLSKWRTGVIDKLSPDDKETIDVVLSAYGDKDAQYLSDLTHSEQPWIEARKGMPSQERGSQVISLAAMMEYYSSLPA